ncbi:aminoglycoside adenylyltransferase domain-containing protein [Paenibacillus planticolens]|uniref:DUF4111 domain-containing protein n=1 Tax=Paenibacillus planticolens TaxID=2654976 RepID=A0ABX1ZXA3_9BACL|nr:aminoglycoside adenylyltransferase domain-containing protein [Paenibacillus planticolens]NOV04592.1 DUF4111 domain-containing protein [Paenibacillus planticolens]
MLDQLLIGVKDVLARDVVGVYVHGSLALGDFNPETSDVDFLVVTRQELLAERLPALDRLHAELRNQGFKWAVNMEGSYISRASLRRYDPHKCRHPALRCDGSFGVDGHASDWIIQRAIIREHGIILSGPPPTGLIDPVEPAGLKKAAQGILKEWWAPLLEDASRLATSEYQAYAVLTMCRCLYTIEKGLVASKPAAAMWMINTRGNEWETLIRQAMAWRRGDELNAIDETLAFVTYTLEHAGK